MSALRVLQILQIAMQIVPYVERLLNGKSGEEKRKAAVDLIVPSVQAAEVILDREVLNEIDLREASGHVVDNVVRILNITGVFKSGTLQD